MWSAPSTDRPGRRVAAASLAATLGLLATGDAATARSWSSKDDLASRSSVGRYDSIVPSTPSGLTLTSVKPTALSISWQRSRDNRTVKGYTLSRDGAFVATRFRTSASFQGLACGRAYTLGVAAFDASGNRSPAATLTASTSACPDTLAPTKPANVTQTGASRTTISLFWSSSLDDVGVAGYGLYRDGVRIGAASATTFVVSGLSCGRSYLLGIDSYDAAGNRSAQTSVLASTTPCPIVAASTRPRVQPPSPPPAQPSPPRSPTPPSPPPVPVPVPTPPQPPVPPLASGCPIGLNHGVFWKEETEWGQLDTFAQGGVKLLRTDFHHGSVERSPGVYDWSRYDRFVAAARARGIKHLATIAYGARWNAPGGNEKAEPVDHAAYANFAREVVRRYGADLAGVEIWNEPWLADFWTNPDPAAYARLARRTADAIRGVNATIPILVSADETPVWYSRVLAADPTLAALDLSVHVYTEDRPPDDTQSELRWRYERWTMSRDLARQYGNPAPRIWLTELGWSSAALGEQRQADYLRRALERGCGDWRGQVQALIVYGWFADQRTSWWEGYGLLRQDTSPKPAWTVLTTAAR